MEYGNIPQNRERIYIVGFRNKLYSDRFEFPGPIKLTTKLLICSKRMFRKNIITIINLYLKTKKIQ